MSNDIGNQIARIASNVSDALTAISNKGVTIPTGSNSDDLADLIGLISSVPDGDYLSYGYALVGSAMVGTAIVGGGGAIVGSAKVGTATI